MKMQGDFSRHHEPLNESFSARVTPEVWEKYRLSDEQVAFFNENGYLSNIRILSDDQVAQLNRELDEIKEPSHPKHDLFYEFHSNESANPDAVL
ncbi:MAG TPA: phytanoyl-CoA dioxygenase family protein, partial [Chryseosolibacter sp.]|nr:phytanoyl-CoA dioxygenase family protein [Chryseosolibacter sp.]